MKDIEQLEAENEDLKSHLELASMMVKALAGAANIDLDTCTVTAKHKEDNATVTWERLIYEWDLLTKDVPLEKTPIYNN